MQLLQNRIPKRIINRAAKKKEKIQVLNEAHDKLTENQRADLQRQLKEIKRVIRAALKAYNKLECEEEKIREQLRSL